MEWDYNTKEEAENVALGLKHLIGKEITHVITNAKCIIKDIFASPNTWYNTDVKELQVRGYDVKVTFTNQPFTTHSKHLETSFILD